MNLFQTIDLYLGGPGSGCNPGVGKCGRPKGSATKSMARNLVQRIHESGGFTYRPASGRSPRQGYALSIDPKNERVLTLTAATPDRIRGILKEYEPVLKADSRTHVGGWVDPESGKVFLDISIVTKDKKEAMALGKKYNQLAVFDLAKGKTVKTGVKRKISAQSEKSKMVRFDFHRGVTAEEISEFLKTFSK